MKEERVVDLGYIREVSGGDQDIERELLGLFLAQADEMAESLDAAYGVQDGKALAAAAHKAKSTALSMGMKETAAALVRLQDIGRNSDLGKKETLAEVAELINFCKLQLDKACEAVRETLGELGGAGRHSN